jgi:hypothetical protein
MKGEKIAYFAIMPEDKTEKANLSKGGGAKPWVYRHKHVTMTARSPKKS